MSRVLIVVYEPNMPGANSERVVKLIKEQANWARLSAFSYLLETNLDPVVLRDQIQPALQHGDKFYVGVCMAPAAWVGLGDEVGKWIIARQVL